MSYNFRFGDFWLSEFGGFTTKMPQLDIAAYDYSLVDIPGKDGPDYVDNHRYKNVVFSREVAFNVQKNLRIRNLPKLVIEWLAYLHGYQDFEDTLHEGFVTKAFLTNFPEIVDVLSKFNTATLKFSRQPYWYRKDALVYENLDLTAESVIVKNPYKAEAKPIIRFYFNQADRTPATIKYTVTTGGDTAEYTMSNIPVDNSINLYVDCEAQEVRSGQGALLKYLDYALPKSFSSGNTTIAVTEGKSRLSELLIMPRWRCLEG